MSMSININFLEKLKENDDNIKRLTDNEKKEITKYFLDNIGNPNPYLRDELIYEIFAYMVYKNIYTITELKSILKELFDENHFKKSGNENVLTRSFSILIIVEIINTNNREYFLSEKEFHDYVNIFLESYQKETIKNGYDDSLGWIHIIAHGADLIGAICLSKQLSQTEIKQIIEVIFYQVLEKNSTYTFKEPNRLANALINLFKNNNINMSIIYDYLKSYIKTTINQIIEIDWSMNKFYLKNNMDNFLKAFYFIIKSCSKKNELIIDEEKQKELLIFLEEMINLLN